MDITKEEVNNLEKAKQAFNVHTLTTVSYTHLTLPTNREV